MTNDLKPYSETRHSGIPWAAKLPSHWGTERAKRLFRKMERPVEDTDEVVTCFRDGVVTLRKNRRVHGFTESLKEIGYQGILRGDLVIHGMDAFAGAAGVSDSNGKGTSVYSVCAPLRQIVNPHYYAYCIREMARSQWVLALAKGIRERSTDFRYAVFASQTLPLPSHSEQTAIVRFLDHADRRIRRYIRAKEKLIALLEEQKQAIIHQAVTGQIDVRTGQPYPAYKPSGVEWLGDVPAHWEISRVKTEFHCLNHRRVPLSGTERGAMTLRRYDYYGASGVIDKVDHYLFDDELLLIAEDGANLVLRNLPLAIIAKGKFWVNNHAHILKPKRGHLEYLADVMESLNYFPWISGAAQPKLTQDRLMGIAVAVPPRLEQDVIVSYGSAETVGLHTAIAHAQSEIILLNEYRIRLISDVVTGKLDVREAAVGLPEIDSLAAEDGVDDTFADDSESDSEVEQAEAAD